MKRKKNSNLWRLIVGFFCLLILPNLLMIFNVNSFFYVSENKQMMSFSEINLEHPIEFIKGFKRAYADNMGLKNISFLMYKKVKKEILKEDPLPFKIVTGKEGWFFLGNNFNNVYDNSTGFSKMSNQEMDKAMENIDRFQRVMKEIGIPFYVLIVSNKHEIYPEFLPLKAVGKPKHDLLFDALGEKYNNVINLKKELLANKYKSQLYHKTDSHWNDIGALIGYNHMINRLSEDFDDLHPIDLEGYNVCYNTRDQMDLTRLINEYIKENILTLEKNKLSEGKLEFWKESQCKFVNETKKRKIVVFRDSFSLAMMDFFKETFSEAYFVKSIDVDLSIIKKEKPDMVVLQLVSRNFDSFY